MNLLLSVSQGQVVFDAQGSRMAMTLIEQLQGKTLPHISSKDVKLQNRELTANGTLS